MIAQFAKWFMLIVAALVIIAELYGVHSSGAMTAILAGLVMALFLE